MTFISYAQNFEDVMLWRALKRVEKGFYIDVGANDPTIDSVTKAFYERGWHGINIEPLASHFVDLQRERPRDINLKCAVGAVRGDLDLWECDVRGWATAEESIVSLHRAEGHEGTFHRVSVLPLWEICFEHVEGQIHFLKIDVEGFEKSVIEGMDFGRYRPWVLIVEATRPNSSEEVHERWEKSVLSAGYCHAYNDGLNRFYVSTEHSELLDAFRYPPNVFDNFIRAEQLGSELRAQDAEAAEKHMGNQLSETQERLSETQGHLSQMQERLSQTQQELEHQIARANSADAEIRELYASSSWRITAPFRATKVAMQNAKSLPSQAILRAKVWLKPHLVDFAAFAAARPGFKSNALRILKHFPQLHARLVRAASGPPNRPHSILGQIEMDPVDRYAEWIVQHETSDKRPSSPVEIGGPVISVLVIATRSRTSTIATTLRSLTNQSVGAWRLVLGSLDLTEPDRKTLNGLNRPEDDRILIVPEVDSTLGAALRKAADAATGDFVVVLEPGDTLPEHAIAVIVERLRDDPEIDILYGDEDLLDGDQRTEPQFKPEWSPELLTAYNYFGRPTIVRRSFLRENGSFASDLGSAAEWDLHLRATQPYFKLVATPHVRRQAEVLCHRHPDSGNGRPSPNDPVSGDFREAAVRHWRRTGLDAKVTTQADGTQHAVWNIAEPPLVSVIIPNKNRAELLSLCLDGLWNKTRYPRLEIIVVDNGSTEPSTLALYEESQEHGVRIVPYNEPFNYSRACNRGARAANGDLLLFLNNDIEIVIPDWLTELVRFALCPGVGVVGTKLVYPNGVLQHAGVVVGPDIFGLVFARAPEYEWGVFGSPSVTRNWMGVMGACQLIRRDLFDRIGGFDEGCVIATSDVRLSLDAWRAGYRTVYAPHGKLIHHEGMTRGHSNPQADMTRTAAALRALGIEEDPYHHPGLSGTTPIPTLRLGADPSAAENLKRDCERRLGRVFDQLIPDLVDDAAMARAAGLSRDSILWEPDPPGVFPDARSAARFMVDLLRRRTDIAKKFPNALSEGADGPFATWLKEEALMRWGYPADAARRIDAAFRANHAEEGRRIVLSAEKGSDRQSLLLHPVGRHALTKLLFASVERGEMSKEGAWWFLLETAETTYGS